MIGVDWGTTGLRAFRLGAGGAVLDRRDTRQGILSVPPGGFPAVLEEVVGAWLDQGEDRILVSGMAGSRQGWAEAPYAACPAGAAELGAALTPVAFPRAEVRLVPGVRGTDAQNTPEVMRGEEVQVLGAGADGTVCLPGSHSKWVECSGGRITGFATHLTGEAFAALRGHTILGRMMAPEPPAGPEGNAAFDRGVARSAEPGGLLHHLFGVRALGLAGALEDAVSAEYLSGLLIGHEVRAALGTRAAPAGPVQLIGAPDLCARYARAIAGCGGTAATGDPDAAARGLWLIGDASWT